MNDKEIIKALEYCKTCNANINEEIIRFINRQRAEIERLQKEVGLVSIQFQDMQELQEETRAEVERLEEESLILKQFINGEWVDCKEIQEALSIDFATGLKRFDFSRTAEWCPAPLCGQKITTKFRLSDNKAIKEFAEKLKKVWFDNGYDSPDVDFDDFVDNLVKERAGENNG